ncbi:hypothetical protein BGZ94_008208, partial [Podila epigama]
MGWQFNFKQANASKVTEAVKILDVDTDLVATYSQPRVNKQEANGQNQVVYTWLG